MQDYWYGDRLDLIKWGVLLRLAERCDAGRILQIALNPRTKSFGRLVIDGEECEVPQEAIAHFRNLRIIGSISTKTQVTVFDPILQDRASHLKAVLAFLSAYHHERCVVFLDPDTGLQPQKQKPTLSHVLTSEAWEIWTKLKAGDVFAFYQHKDNMAGQPWIEPKQRQLENALRVAHGAVKIARALTTHPDVVILYTERQDPPIAHR